MACMGSKGKGRMEELSYTDPQFSLGTYVPMQRTRDPIDNKETLIYIFKKYIPRPFPLTTTHPKNPPHKKANPSYKSIALTGNREREQRRIIIHLDLLFHYVSTNPSKGLGIMWNNTQNAANIYIYLKNIYNQTPPPKKQPNIYSTIAHQAMRDGEYGIFFIESISMFIKYLNSHAKDNI